MFHLGHFLTPQYLWYSIYNPKNLSHPSFVISNLVIPYQKSIQLYSNYFGFSQLLSGLLLYMLKSLIVNSQDKWHLNVAYHCKAGKKRLSNSSTNGMMNTKIFHKMYLIINTENKNPHFYIFCWLTSWGHKGRSRDSQKRGLLTGLRRGQLCDFLYNQLIFFRPNPPHLYPPTGHTHANNIHTLL